MTTRPHILSAIALTAAFGCSPGPEPADTPAPDPPNGSSDVERAVYLTRIGDDTLAVEWVAFGPDRVEAEALIRGSSTTFRQYRLEFGAEGEVETYSERIYAGGTADAPLTRTTELEGSGAGRVLVTRDPETGEEERFPFDAPPVSVPFIDMLHWPFEAALRWHAREGGWPEEIPVFTGRGMRFGLIDNADGTFGLRHPSRGVSTMEVDAEGRLLTLDGTGSTRAYDLRRLEAGALDRAAIGARFADRPLGELSGRGEIDDVVHGVRFSGDYGTPLRRGRDIFGELVAYGAWWRTGANRATHLSFDGDIVIDGERIPAGDYTLSSIPEEDGGILIINRQTGQGGQSYDESMDQARVRMRRDRLPERVEVFTIRAVPDGEAGRLELRWDDTVYWVPFTVAG